MPSHPMEWRKRGLRCSELAERATNSQVKAVLTYLAEQWLKMARPEDFRDWRREADHYRPDQQLPRTEGR